LPGKIADLIDTIVIQMSVISRIELLAWPRASMSQILALNSFINICIVHNLNEKIIIKTIELRKDHRIKLPDAIIAATAITNDLTLITRNIADFKKVTDLELIDPYKV
jgi:predicted nucleic acid-binding protein